MIPSEKLMHWYANLTPDTLHDLHYFYEADATFKDPFNDVQGLQAISVIFEHMFKTTVNPHFIFLDKLEQSNQLFVTWLFHFGLNGKQYTIHGGSHIKFSHTGLVMEHRDYWDVAEELWQKLPLIGTLTTWLRRKFTAKT